GLEGATQGERSGPGIERLPGDDVDHPAHRVGTVQGRHRPADHLDALDRVQRRDVVELVAAEVVRVDVAVVVLAAAVDEDQGVVRAHAAQRDGALAGLVAGFADVHALQVAHRVEQGDVRALREVLAGDHADAGRCVDDLLLDAGRGDHHGVEIDRIGGGRRRGQGRRGEEQGEGAGERGPARGADVRCGHGWGVYEGAVGARPGTWRAAAGQRGAIERTAFNRKPGGRVAPAREA